MKILILFLVISANIFAQDFMKVFDDKSNKIILVGETNRKEYQGEQFSNWFNKEYTNYKVDFLTTDKIKNYLDGKLIKIVLGTWCSDSRREVPRVLKILDFVGFPEDKILLMNVNRMKKGIRDEVDNLDIQFVPTIIVYENGKEIGRIIETPKETLEKDLLEIVKK